MGRDRRVFVIGRGRCLSGAVYGPRGAVRCGEAVEIGGQRVGLLDEPARFERGDVGLQRLGERGRRGGERDAGRAAVLDPIDMRLPWIGRWTTNIDSAII